MNKIIDYDRDSLIALIDNSLPQIEKQYTFLTELNKLIKKYNELYFKKEKKKSNLDSMCVATVVLLVLLVMLIACIVKIFNQSSLNLYNPVLIVLTLIYIFVVLLIPIIYFSSVRSVEKKYNKCKEKLDIQINEINDYRARNDTLQIIPFMYQTPIAMQEITIYLINYRATNWTTAVNILEDTIHKNQMIYLQSKQLSTLNQQLNTLNGIKKNTETSGFDVVKFIIGVVG